MKNPFRRRKGVTPGAPRVYGFDKTIHRNEVLDVEVRHGEVVAVWFRCQPLPFNQSNAAESRAKEMRSMYAEDQMPGLVAVTVQDAP